MAFLIAMTKRSATLVEVITDEGISGWGEAFNQGLEPPQISAALIERALQQLVLGTNTLEVDVPDITSAGGFTACRHILALAQAHGIPVDPHVWGSAVAQAASLQLMAAIPVAHHSVVPSEPIFAYDRSAHPFRQSLVKEPIRQVGGWIEIPRGPGLGIEVDSQWIGSASKGPGVLRELHQ
jgi:L-alanine-DL-glutamate epimerase-like enolase superfamily enzyme